jgi:hypothetical protein
VITGGTQGLYDENPYEEEDNQINDEQYFQKERELKELNDLRIRTLERLIREKVDIIHA